MQSGWRGRTGASAPSRTRRAQGRRGRLASPHSGVVFGRLAHDTQRMASAWVRPDAGHRSGGADGKARRLAAASRFGGGWRPPTGGGRSFAGRHASPPNARTAAHAEGDSRRSPARGGAGRRRARSAAHASPKTTHLRSVSPRGRLPCRVTQGLVICSPASTPPGRQSRSLG